MSKPLQPIPLPLRTRQLIEDALRERDIQEAMLARQNATITALVEAAALAGEPLAGHTAAAWQAWGTVFTELQIWLSTPIASIGKTPLQVLMTRYVAQQEAA